MEAVVVEEEVRHLVESLDYTHTQVSEELRGRFPNLRGLSSRSVRRYCESHAIHKYKPVDDDHLDVVVAGAIQLSGPSYGRKMMKGLLNSLDLRVSERRIAQTLFRLAPVDYAARSVNMGRRTNPLTVQRRVPWPQTAR